MKIVVNTRLLLPNRLEGIGWVTYEALRRICTAHPEHQFIFLFDRPYSEEFIFSNNIQPVVIPPQSRHPVLWYLWFEYSVSWALGKHRADLFLSPDGYLSLRTKVPSIPIIHDLNFVHLPHEVPKLVSKYYNYYFPKFAHKGKRIITVSEFSKKDISESFGVSKDKIDVVYNGANEIYKPVDGKIKQETKDKYSEGSDYFIFIGALLPRKNIERLLNAFDVFKEQVDSDIRLLIVGNKMFMTEGIEKAYKTMKHRDKVVFTGRVSNETLHHLLASSMALTFVPYFEGFGIPIVEAMYCGVPVITSNVTSMPEIAGDTALLVDPYCIDSIKDAMLRIYKDKELRLSLVENSKKRKDIFRWQNTAKGIWASIEKCLS